jgi:hypothetical protein
MPASDASSASRSAVSGDCSAGLSTTLFPVASAGPIFQDAIISGKFQGTTAPTPPSGSRTIETCASGPVGAISSYTLSIASPYHAMHSVASGTSTFVASRIGLPMSIVSSRASSSAWSDISPASFWSTRFRFFGARRDQTPDSNAARAPVTARSTSAESHAATRATTSPVIGLTQSNVSPETASTYPPSTNAWARMSRPATASATVRGPSEMVVIDSSVGFGAPCGAAPGSYARKPLRVRLVAREMGVPPVRESSR